MKFPEIANFFADGQPALTFQDLTDIRFGSGMAVAGCSEELATAVVQSGKSRTVELIRTDNNYGKVYPFRFLAGSFHLTGQPSAVIGERLSNDLFHGNPAGKMVTIEGTQYFVSGVFQENENRIEALSGRYDSVYLLNTEKKQPLSLICFKTEKLLDCCSSKLDSGIQSILKSYQSDSTAEDKNLFFLPHRLLWSIILIALAFLFLYLIVCIIKDMKARLLESLVHNYIGKAVVRNKSYLGIGLLKIVACAAAADLCYAFIPRIDLPPGFISTDNIFNLSYFSDAFADFVRKQNVLLTLNYYGNLMRLSAAVLFTYDVGILILLIDKTGGYFVPFLKICSHRLGPD